ncbi:MAG: ADP-heptose--LPS heptosyltransferase 2 [Desulfovibrio sp.]
MSKIGVWNTAFLGDAILTLPLLQTVRKAFPDAEIDFWVRKPFGALFAAHPAVSQVYEYDKRGKDKGIFRAFRLGNFLGNERYALWISAHASPRSGLIARWSSAKTRIGYDKPACNALFYTHIVPRKFAELEEIERLGQLLLPLDLEQRGVTPDTWPDIVLPQGALADADAFFTALKTERDAPVLGLHPGSIWGTKRWPLEYYAAIAARAAKEGAHVLVFGGPGEEERMAGEVCDMAAASLSPGAAGNIRNRAGMLSLPALAAYIGRLSCYATNDSGPMHLAWPQHVPVTAMFGPTVRALGFYPRGTSATVMELPLECRPCGLHGPQECPLGHHNCMREMVPDLVWPVIERNLW